MVQEVYEVRNAKNEQIKVCSKANFLNFVMTRLFDMYIIKMILK